MSSPCPQRKRARLSRPHPPRTRNCGSLPRKLRRKQASRSGSTSPRFSTKPIKKRHTSRVRSRGRPGRLEQAPPRACGSMLDRTTGRCAMPQVTAPTRGAIQPAGFLFLKATKTKSKGGSHGYGHGQMPANRTRDPHRHQDRSRELSAQPGVFRAHPLPDLPHRAHLVRTGSLGRRAERLGAAWQRGLPGLIVHTGHRCSRWRDTMAHMQISTETSTWLLQAKDFLVEARRLKPGPARNELRQVAKVLRELAKLEAQSESALDFGRPERT